jgi:hypothetical protein
MMLRLGQIVSSWVGSGEAHRKEQDVTALTGIGVPLEWFLRLAASRSRRRRAGGRAVRRGHRGAAASRVIPASAGW